LNEVFTTTSRSAEGAGVTGIDELIERLERGEFDLVAIGRSLIVNPDWPKLVRRGALDELKPFQKDVLQELV
jgi:2,4-dienoyl-CoA reductase-like NADH-dependent reductase (Old Yellow Enzyme family)